MYSAELANVKKENAAQLATIKRQDLRLENPLIQMKQIKFGDSETDTGEDSDQQGRKRKRTKNDNEQYWSVGSNKV